VLFITSAIVDTLRGRGPELVLAITFGSFAATFIGVLIIEVLLNARIRERNYVKLTGDKFVFRSDKLTVSYAWDRLRNARVEERIIHDVQTFRAYYFTADVIEPALQAADRDTASTVMAVAIPLDGFEMPAAGIGKLMVRRTLAARPQPK
jgi:hypothetical protein